MMIVGAQTKFLYTKAARGEEGSVKKCSARKETGKRLDSRTVKMSANE